MISRISLMVLASCSIGLLSRDVKAAECPPLAILTSEPTEMGGLLDSNWIAPTQMPPASQPQSGSTPSRLDVNGDGHITPIDALMVINRLNSAWSSASGQVNELANQDLPFDTNQDGLITPQDVIGIIEELNRRTTSTPVAKQPATTPEITAP